MSKQILYKTEQYTMYKDKKLHIRFDEEYFDSIPRSMPEERSLLKEDIQKDGLIDDIKINQEGIVLDGHTRIEICEELGWKKLNEEPIIARYTVKEFKDKDEERIYVIKTNLIRRQLNSFQKIRLIFKLYQTKKENPHTEREQTMYDILVVLNKCDEPVRATEIAEKMGKKEFNIRRLLNLLKDDFCVSRNEKIQKHKNSKGANIYFIYSILPKGEEILSKGRPTMVSLSLLGRAIGLERNLVSKAIFLMEHANEFTLRQLESGRTSIMHTYLELTRDEKQSRAHSSSYLRSDTEVICPHCKKVSQKKDWKLVKDGTK